MGLTGFKPLMRAALTHNAQMARLLLEFGADVHAEDEVTVLFLVDESATERFLLFIFFCSMSVTHYGLLCKWNARMNVNC